VEGMAGHTCAFFERGRNGRALGHLPIQEDIDCLNEDGFVTM
jgi:hypothetical protein